MTRSSIVLAAAMLLTVPAIAQTPQHSPYAGEEARTIKALSPKEIDDLKQGRGMGLAKPAELNGYPGPAHVLELADALGLDPEQLTQTRRLHARMLAEARRLGAAIIEAEAQLERRFAHRHIDGESLRSQTAKIAALQGELRAVHLDAHLEQSALLTAEQAARYARLRGYGANAQPADHRSRHPH